MQKSYRHEDMPLQKGYLVCLYLIQVFKEAAWLLLMSFHPWALLSLKCPSICIPFGIAMRAAERHISDSLIFQDLSDGHQQCGIVGFRAEITMEHKKYQINASEQARMWSFSARVRRRILPRHKKGRWILSGALSWIQGNIKYLSRADFAYDEFRWQRDTAT